MAPCEIDTIGEAPLCSIGEPVAEYAATDAPGDSRQRARGSCIQTASYSLGLFMEPLGAEFGWSRAQISAGLTIPALTMALLSPAIGAAVDRWGSRRLALPGLVLTAVAQAAFGFANGSMTQWLGLWAFYAFATLGLQTTVWTTAVSSTFTLNRGLALGVTLAGTALGQTFIPPLTNWLITTFGWRQAYAWLGVGWGVPCFLIAFFFLYDARDRQRRSPREGASSMAALPGLEFREALCSVPLIRIGISTLLTMFAGTAVLVHQVPILTEAGVSRTEAAWLASLAGLAGVIGKLVTGWLTDRFSAGVVGALTLSVPAIAFLALLEPFRSPALIVAAMVIVGYAAGGKLQISAYLTARYAGMRNFGKIFGLMTSMVALGGGLGPTAAGAIYDRFGSYAPLLIFGALGSLACGLLVFKLGPYPVWERSGSPTPAVEPAGRSAVAGTARLDEST
ncbi:MFS transporter [Phenylobacterium sp. LjRoot219]|uniref:MFS transporter n=1 Tax=Phenylobacterium sp. LjRoot219 TaxID=3342283 RepID=UPI003ECD7582